MSTSPPRGVRRTDHRAYAVTCPREACKAPPWHACVTFVGAASSQEPRSLEEPHRERVDAERAEKTTAKRRTPDLFEEYRPSEIDDDPEGGGPFGRSL